MAPFPCTCSLCYVVAAFLLMLPAEASGEALLAGANTKGGMIRGARIIHVTTLDDVGPGSLREALTETGPRLVVFDVAGTIELQSDLVVREPFLTVAGQTAPDTGVTLYGASLRLRSHDVVVQHIAVRPGSSDSTKINDNRDAISLDGRGVRSDGKDVSRDIVLDHISASWSVDETISLWYGTTRDVTISNSIIGEALRNAGHPKDDHSMGLLVGPDIAGVDIHANMLVSNAFRNPAISQGASIYFANNYIFNPGHNGVHFYNRKTQDITRMTIVSNLFERGLDTSRTMAALTLQRAPQPDLMDVFVANNAGERDFSVRGDLWFRNDFPTRSAPVLPKNYEPRSVADLKDHILRQSGMLPKRRNAVDSALLERIKERTEKIIDHPPSSDLELLAQPPVYVRASVPDDLHHLHDEEDVDQVSRWLKDRE